MCFLSCLQVELGNLRPSSLASGSAPLQASQSSPVVGEVQEMGGGGREEGQKHNHTECPELSSVYLTAFLRLTLLP